MREIKFRAWDEDRKRMLYDLSRETVHFNDADAYGSNDGTLFVSNDMANGDYQELELMQFTGLLDRNKKEIYEGDVVEVENGDGEILTQCVFEPGYFNLVDNAGGSWTRQLFHQQQRLTVLGNIYENPELLTND